MPSDDEERRLDEGDEEISAERDTLLELIPHYHRGEVTQTTTALDRLDQTTNWAVTLIAALVTVVFSARDISPHLLLIGLIIILIFLAFDVRRYRDYDFHRARIRLVEENVFANALDPRGAEHPHWREELSDDLRNPTYKVTLREAISRRLRRVYGFLLGVVGLAWVAEITFLASEPWTAAARMGPFPGEAAVLIVGSFFIAIFAIAKWPGDREAKGEIHGETPGRWK